jgi:hypothetical protein
MAQLLAILGAGAYIALLLCFPLLVIWSVNTLFGLSIAYSFTNWFATIVLGIFIRSGITNATNKSKE